jgi:octaprenyl-diphosphate synthase
MLGGPDVLERLGAMSRERNLKVASRLDGMVRWLGADLHAIEEGLVIAPRTHAVHESADHLVRLGGKRLRPVCVVLAAKLGSGFDARAKELAVAVELVHSATLLHDDVVDLGDTRRGAPAARLVYGNAISIFAGDWLLVDALRRVRQTALPGVLERLLDVIDEMIVAESLQLERRGRLEPSVDAWTSVARGKTAALFRWAMFAGARAGGLTEDDARHLEEYGAHVGMAFQAIDDVLDLTGDSAKLGKEPFADLREGKCSLPIALALAAQPSLTDAIARVAAGQAVDGEASALGRAIASTGAIERSKLLAHRHVENAIGLLDRFAPSAARDALADVAHAMVMREV